MVYLTKREKRRIYYLKNRERILAKVKAYRKANAAKVSTYAKGYREANPEKHLVHAAAHRARRPDAVKRSRKKWLNENRESERARSAQWKKENPDRARRAARLWRLANLDDIKARERVWRKANAHLVCLYAHSRRSRKKKAFHPSCDVAAVTALLREAADTTARTGVKHQLDHIIPLSRGGFHHHQNLQVLPASENASKRDNPFWESSIYKTWRDVPSSLWPEGLGPHYSNALLADVHIEVLPE